MAAHYRSIILIYSVKSGGGVDELAKTAIVSGNILRLEDDVTLTNFSVTHFKYSGESIDVGVTEKGQGALEEAISCCIRRIGIPDYVLPGTVILTPHHTTVERALDNFGLKLSWPHKFSDQIRGVLGLRKVIPL